MSQSVARLGAVGGAGDDGGDSAVVVALEADQLTPDPNDAAEIDAGRLEPRGGARGDDPGEVAARADRLELGRAGRDDDLVGA